jgi:amphi-Trp domain-containing protein
LLKRQKNVFIFYNHNYFLGRRESMEKDISFDGTMEQNRLVHYLEELTSSLKTGKVCIQDGDDYVLLRPTKTVRVKFEAEQDRDKDKLSIKLSWSKKDLLSPTSSFRISATEPPAKEEKKKDDKNKGEGKKSDEKSKNDKDQKADIAKGTAVRDEPKSQKGVEKNPGKAEGKKPDKKPGKA